MFLGRHTESNFNVRYPGFLDKPDHAYKPQQPDADIPKLSSRGRLQARTHNRFLDLYNIEGVVTAQTQRAMMTGAIATYGAGIPLFVDGGLNEVNWGELAGKRTKDVFTGSICTDGRLKGLDY